VNTNRFIEITKTQGGAPWRSFSQDAGLLILSGIKLSWVRPDVFLSTDSDIPINVSNSVDTPIKSLLNTTLGMGLGGITFQDVANAAEFVTGTAGNDSVVYPWFSDVKTWSGTSLSPLTLSFSFKLGQFDLWNAYEEVVLPSIALLVPVLMKDLGTITSQGPFASIYNLLGTAVRNATNPSLLEDKAGLLESINDILLSSINNYTYEVKFGEVYTLSHAIYKDANVSFSTEVDQHGYPIASKVSITFVGQVPPALKTSPSNIAGLRFGKENNEKQI
jgi:hypothetical protein